MITNSRQLIRPFILGTTVGWLCLAHGCGGRESEPAALTPPGSISSAGDPSAADFGDELSAGAGSQAPSGTGSGEAGPVPGSLTPGAGDGSPAGSDGNTFAGTSCIGGTTACTNCIDDDGDGKVDALDTECTGPLDNDEATFATGIPGDNRDFCQDCFFDGNSGHGDDGCQYNTECLYGREPAAAGGAACFRCEVSDRCRASCQQFTPNGCDCFGCCEVHALDGSVRNVRLGGSCSQGALDDPSQCEACVPTLDCYNDCGPCELCIGRPAPGPDCNPGDTPPSECAPGLSACSPESPCPADQYCLTGCCVEVSVIR